MVQRFHYAYINRHVSHLCMYFLSCNIWCPYPGSVCSWHLSLLLWWSGQSSTLSDIYTSSDPCWHVCAPLVTPVICTESADFRRNISKIGVSLLIMWALSFRQELHHRKPNYRNAKFIGKIQFGCGLSLILLNCGWLKWSRLHSEVDVNMVGSASWNLWVSHRMEKKHAKITQHTL